MLKKMQFYSKTNLNQHKMSQTKYQHIGPKTWDFDTYNQATTNLAFYSNKASKD